MGTMKSENCLPGRNPGYHETREEEEDSLRVGLGFSSASQTSSTEGPGGTTSNRSKPPRINREEAARVAEDGDPRTGRRRGRPRDDHAHIP